MLELNMSNNYEGFGFNAYHLADLTVEDITGYMSGLKESDREILWFFAINGPIITVEQLNQAGLTDSFAELSIRLWGISILDSESGSLVVVRSHDETRCAVSSVTHSTISTYFMMVP